MVLLKLDDGLLEGDVKDNHFGAPYYSFKGIPYAEPPVGDFRFKPPKPNKPWTGVRPAKEFGTMCYQRNMFGRDPPAGSEDCLYINVYSPDLSPKALLPVMFWIHGGAYIWGSGNDDMYGPEFLVRHGVVLVTFNYRIGVLGFLCLDTQEIPGNVGMKDQVLALKWVNKNIAKFGGDPNNVTIFGESAGGSCTGFHLVSPMSVGLFKRAILQSGVHTAFWATASFHREKALELAKQLGCHSENDKQLYEFLKKQPVEALIDLKLQVTFSNKPYEIDFGVVIEKDFGQERFFYDDPLISLRKNLDSNVEIMLGYTEHEGLLALGSHIYEIANKYIEFFVPKRISIEIPLHKQMELGRKIKSFYFKDSVISHKQLDVLLKYLSMDFFVYDIIAAAKLFATENTTYLYKFTCKSERNQMRDILNLQDTTNGKPVVCHTDDLPYIFPVKLIKHKLDKESDTFKLIDDITKLWTNFARYGNPTPDNHLNVEWIPFSNEKQDYLDIGNSLVLRNHPEKEEVEFWEDIYREYLPRYNWNCNRQN